MRTAAALEVVLADSVAVEVVVEVFLRVVVEVVLEWVAVDRLVEDKAETEVETIYRVSECLFHGVGEGQNAISEAVIFCLLLTRGSSGDVGRMGCSRRKSA